MSKGDQFIHFDQTYLPELTRLVDRVGKTANQVLATVGISFSQYQVLASLSQNPDFLQAQIAQAMGVTPAVVTRQITQLSERGLVHQSQDPHNRRRNQITITAAGQRLVESAGTLLNQRFQKATKTLKGGDLALFLRCIQQINDAFEN